MTDIKRLLESLDQIELSEEDDSDTAAAEKSKSDSDSGKANKGRDIKKSMDRSIDRAKSDVKDLFRREIDPRDLRESLRAEYEQFLSANKSSKLIGEDGRGGSDWKGGWKDVKSTATGSPIRAASGGTVKSRDWSADTPSVAPNVKMEPQRGLELKPIMPTMRAPDYKDRPLDVVDYYGDVKDPKSSVLVRPLAPKDPIEATPLDSTSSDSKKGPNYTISSPSASWKMDGKTGSTTAGAWEHEFDDEGHKIRSVMPGEPDFDINREIDRSLPSTQELLGRDIQESIDDLLKLSGLKR